MTVDEAKLLPQGIFLSPAQRLSEKVEYTHDRIQTDAGHSASTQDDAESKASWQGNL